jgi:hypothetical protein
LKRIFFNFLSIKAAYLIPQLTIRDSGVWLDEQAQHYAYTLLLHAASANQRTNMAMKCDSPTRIDCAAAAWDILCDRLDGRSFARSLSPLDNLIVRQRLGQSLSDYVHYKRQKFDDYNETCQTCHPPSQPRSPHAARYFQHRSTRSGPIVRHQRVRSGQRLPSTSPFSPAQGLHEQRHSVQPLYYKRGQCYPQVARHVTSGKVGYTFNHCEVTQFSQPFCGRLSTCRAAPNYLNTTLPAMKEVVVLGSAP